MFLYVLCSLPFCVRVNSSVWISCWGLPFVSFFSLFLFSFFCVSHSRFLACFALILFSTCSCSSSSLVYFHLFPLILLLLSFYFLFSFPCFFYLITFAHSLFLIFCLFCFLLFSPSRLVLTRSLDISAMNDGDQTRDGCNAHRNTLFSLSISMQ